MPHTEGEAVVRIVPDNHAAECAPSEGRGSERREGPLLDHIGRELRGLFAPVEGEPLPDVLRALAARLDRRRERSDAA